MKDTAELKRALSAARKLKQQERLTALKRVWAETRTLEREVATHPNLIGFYEVRELREFIVELDGWIKKADVNAIARKYA